MLAHIEALQALLRTLDGVQASSGFSFTIAVAVPGRRIQIGCCECVCFLGGCMKTPCKRVLRFKD